MLVVQALLAATVLGRGRAAASAADQLARDVSRVEAVREIKDLQRTFGQLAAYGQWGAMAALFAEAGVLRWGTGKSGSILAASDAPAVTGPAAIEEWLRADAGAMDGRAAGSLHALVNEMPVVTLATDGRSAKGRWHALRLLGDGKGATRIQGGIFENEYTLAAAAANASWKISLLRYYPMFEGDYKGGWKNAGGLSLPVVPYHFTPDDAGTPVIQRGSKSAPIPAGGAGAGAADLDELEYRISQLNDEDEVRNLQHAYGYYIDRRMWADVVDLFAADGTFAADGATATGTADIRKTLADRMGPEGLTQGILNDHNLFETIVQVAPGGHEATTRGLEVAMVGDASAKSASWEFSVFRNRFVKEADSGIWKIKDVELTRLVKASYAAGWGGGGALPHKADAAPPAFLDVLPRTATTPARRPAAWKPFFPSAAAADPANATASSSLLADLLRRLSRSSAFDETENVSGAYGFYADDIRCALFAGLHATNGTKESPGTGWYRGPARIERACSSRYGTSDRPADRPRVPFHWRPQPVVLVSADGRAATLRARILQTGTARDSAGGFSGVFGFNGGMYHDQFVLEEDPKRAAGEPKRRLWCLTIDEFYWNSASWAGGWAGVAGGPSGGAAPAPAPGSGKGKGKGKGTSSRSSGAGGGLAAAGGESEDAAQQQRRQTDFPPDVSLKDAKMTERESGFNGGPTAAVRWPQIQRMWWPYRHPVTGRPPSDTSYWGPGCVPCRTARPDWALGANGFLEPPTGPTVVRAAAAGAGSVAVTVVAGPEEPVAGPLEVRSGDVVVARGAVGAGGTATLAVSGAGLSKGDNALAVYFLGSDRLKPGKATVVVNVP